MLFIYTDTFNTNLHPKVFLKLIPLANMLHLENIYSSMNKPIL